MTDMLKTSVSGLIAFQRVLTTTSHNISNASTEGYSRQKVELQSRLPQYFGNGFVGRGVNATTITRVRDQFIDKQLQQGLSDQSRLNIFHSLSSRVDNLLADGGGSLAPTLQRFFNSMQDVATDPTSTSARQVLLGEGDNLSNRLLFLDQQLYTQEKEVNARMGEITTDINRIANNIAELNKTIIIAQGQAGGTLLPNDLYDQRDKLVTDLSKLVKVTTLEEDTGALNVFIGNGQALVASTDARQLVNQQNPDNFAEYVISYQTPTGTVLINNQLTGGELGGLLDFRREVLTPARNELGRITIALADQFNQQHSLGVDLNGNTGADFFSTPTGTAITSLLNAGTASATVNITNSGALTTSDYRLSYDGANYTLTRLSDNNAITGAGPLSMDGFTVSATAGAVAGDTFLVRPTYGAASQLNRLILTTSEIAAAAPMRVSQLSGNIGNANVSYVQTLDATNADFSDTVEIVFNDPPTTFNILNITDSTTISAGVAYTAGANIDVNGNRLSISGIPQNGDRFRLEVNTNGYGDNRNALALANLQSANIIAGGTVQNAYASTVGRIGTLTRQAEINATAQDNLVSQAQAARDARSGVNLDEEAVNLVRYQQAYEASAKVISVADNLFQTILAAFGR
ncbi:MAG: flagellar hook-associated protein FlgK [Gammaproteobacteria bacterium]|nr:flagellar hook-associated protein FlgK [Gammaproteobacteria bacterium]